jgi:hypothetical protein
MKVALLNPMPPRRGAMNKDISGGFGTVSDFGDGTVARALTWLKRRGVRYPVLSLAYIAAIFERAGWQVAYSENGTPPGADLALVYTSLVAHRAEVDVANRARSAECRRWDSSGPWPRSRRRSSSSTRISSSSGSRRRRWRASPQGRPSPGTSAACPSRISTACRSRRGGTSKPRAFDIAHTFPRATVSSRCFRVAAVRSRARTTALTLP